MIHTPPGDNKHSWLYEKCEQQYRYTQIITNMYIIHVLYNNDMNHLSYRIQWTGILTYIWDIYIYINNIYIYTYTKTWPLEGGAFGWGRAAPSTGGLGGVLEKKRGEPVGIPQSWAWMLRAWYIYIHIFLFVSVQYIFIYLFICIYDIAISLFTSNVTLR